MSAPTPQLPAPGAAIPPGTGTGAAASARAVLTPTLDVLLVGGLSLLAMLAFVASGSVAAGEPVLERFAILGGLINAPHFMASYFLLYGSREATRRYPSVSLVAPLLLVAWATAGLLLFDREPALLRLLYVLSAVLLAWHYTGQAFGMMASFSFVDGLFLEPLERKLVRVNLHALLGWHVIWALELEVRHAGVNPEAAAFLAQALRLATPIAAATALLGALGLARLWRRTGRRPGLRVLLPWLAVHGWYALMLVDSRAIFLAQISHALQYLAFPIRVQLNRDEAAAPGGRAPLRVARYLALLLAASAVAYLAIPWLLERGTSLAGLVLPSTGLALAAVINVHHYLVDGVVWKLSNPKVRQDLFAHFGRGS